MTLDEYQSLKIKLNKLSNGVIIINNDNQVTFINSAVEKIQNISIEEAIGQNIVLCENEKYPNQIKEKLQSFNIEKEEKDSGILHNLKEQVSQLSTELQELFISSMTSLVKTLEAKDSYTKGHSVRVSTIAKTIAQHKYGDSNKTEQIKLAGKLHDIGKVGTQETILNKPGRLTDQEFDHIKRHPIISEEILNPIKRFESITHMVRHHHEKFDGTGYPDGLAGKEIPIGARIVALADSYDAMTSNRPYRSAMEPIKAAKEIEENLGTQFDPKLGEIFLGLFYDKKLVPLP
ncbi:HD domain-containing phosphohydrolase [Selenihalanaerobacter shriftii]|uniref:HDIG domain-containing protein n=1 Tax=Selenihalanaerobacter shriftii TaxID=142842 RepID=A0A1T4PHT8_9FIRM|nr:HD-GYP domain-containing protein [Selenihalanaerobacter shriftii]SJZ91130.1 HDIG domain-containing protein [Selenihalanaerobacter shriftii]